jgi:hypothetical protein
VSSSGCRTATAGSPAVFDLARFSYDNVIAADSHVVAVLNIGVTGTDAITKIARMKNLRSFDS